MDSSIKIVFSVFLGLFSIFGVFSQDVSYLSISEIKLTSDTLKKTNRYKNFIEIYNANSRRSKLKGWYLSADPLHLDQCRLSRKFAFVKGNGYRTYGFKYDHKSKSRVVAGHDSTAYVFLSQQVEGQYYVVDSLKVKISGEPGSYGYLPGDSVPLMLNASTRNRVNRVVNKEDVCARKVRSFYYGPSMSYTFDSPYSSIRPLITWGTGYQYVNQIRPWYFIVSGIGFEKRGYKFLHEEKTDVAKGIFTRTLRGKNQFYNMNFSFGSGFNIYSDLTIGFQTRWYIPFQAKEIATEVRVLTFDDGSQIVDDRGETEINYTFNGFNLGWVFSATYRLSENYKVEIAHDTFSDVIDQAGTHSSLFFRIHANLNSRRHVYHRNLLNRSLF